MNTDTLYPFIYRGQLAEASLDKAGRIRRQHFGLEDSVLLRQSLSFDLLDVDCLATAERMSLVYTAIHAFENSLRNYVTRAMAEAHGAEWWSKVPDRIQRTVSTRMSEDAKFRWHSSRGQAEINYCDFGDLSSIITTNWQFFEPVIANLEWAKGVLAALEKSRNIVMHGGALAKEDIERIGVNIRDWIRQTG